MSRSCADRPAPVTRLWWSNLSVERKSKTAIGRRRGMGACKFSAKTGGGDPVNRASGRKPPLAPDGVALHAAWVGGGFEDPAFGGVVAGAAREAALGPRVADPQAVAAPRQFGVRCFRKPALERQEAGLRGARVERTRHVLGVEGRAVDRLLQVHAVVDMV